MVHGYSGVDMRIVWDTIHEDLPLLKQELEKYLG
ncbi:MAG: HepT-like ribonuclease domain-containing protein [Candidatus Ornithomonoglobus sp.]